MIAWHQMRSVVRVLAAVLFAVVLAPSVWADRDPTPRKWREFVFGQVRPDGIEYFDFEVKDDAYRVLVSFDRGASENPGPTMLIKYGSLPTSSNYDQRLFLNESSDFYYTKIDNLRSGRYFMALVGGSTFDSMTSFVGRYTNLFYFVNVWYFGCSDSTRTGARCNVPVLPAQPITTPTTANLASFYPDRGVNNGCLDNSRSTVYYIFDVKDSEWDMTLKLTTSSSAALRVIAGANLREPADVKDGPLTKSINVPAGSGERSATLKLTAPVTGQWMVAVSGSVGKDTSCANGSGASFTLTASHERDCANVDGGKFQTSSSLPSIDLCSISFTRLSEVRDEPDKRDTVLDVSFEADKQVMGDGKAAATSTQPVAGYVVNVPAMYAGANLELTALVTDNILAFQVYARVGGYPTPSRFDYQFNSSGAIDAVHDQNSTAEWAYEVQEYKWKSIVFPKVGEWYLLFVADSTLSVSETRANNGSFWAVDLSLQTYACPASACSSHGVCDLAQTYRGLSYGECSCFYGYGGMQCELETVEPKFRHHQIFLLIFSNMAIIPVTILSCRRKLYLEGTLFFTTGLVSAVYHACDTELVCIMPFRFLQEMDFALSFNMIMMLSVHLSGARKQAKAGVEIVMFLLTILMATNHATSMANWVLIGAFCVLQFSVTHVYYFVMGSQRIGMGKMVALKAFLFHSQNFDVRYGILGVVLWVAALGCWFTSSPSNYWLIHSIWHIGAMFSAFCFIGFRKNDRYKMIAPTTGIDVLGPNYTTTAAPMKQFGISNSITISSEKEVSTAERTTVAVDEAA